MKPTNIFRSYEKYYDQKIKSLTKKTGKNNIEKLNNLAQIQNLMQNQDEQANQQEQCS